MTVNCVNIRGVFEHCIANIDLLVRFNKTREIFPSVTRVISMVLTTAAASASVERVNSKSVYHRFHVRFQLCTEVNSLQQ